MNKPETIRKAQEENADVVGDEEYCGRDPSAETEIYGCSYEGDSSVTSGTTPLSPQVSN